MNSKIQYIIYKLLQNSPRKINIKLDIPIVSLDLAKKMVTELASAEGKSAGLAAAQKAAEEEIGKQDLTGFGCMNITDHCNFV